MPDTKNKQENIKDSLAEYLGIEAEDINDDDSLVDDLHMAPSDISDFLAILEEKGIDISNLDIKSIDTISEFIENLNLEEY